MENVPPIYTKAKAVEYLRTIPERHNRKRVQAYNNIIMMSRTSSLNIAIKKS